MDGYVPFGGSGNEPDNAGGDDVSSLSSFGSAAPFLTGGNVGSDNPASGRDSGGNAFDPEQHAGPDKLNADGTYRRKRGRKSGGNNTAGHRNKTRANTEAGVATITRMLAIVHAGLASATKTPELNLEQDDAKALAEATARVLDEFDIRPDPKIEAVIGLVTVASVVYGPRAYMINVRRKMEKEARNSNG